VHNNASIQIYGGKIADENGNDALRNLADNLAGGALEIGLPFTFVSDFSNAGAVTLSQKTTMPAGHRYHQSAGTTVVSGTNFTGTLEIEGGTLEGVSLIGSAHSGIPPKSPSITGNVTMGAAVLTPAQLSVTGDVTLSSDSTLHYVAAFPDSAVTGANVSGKLTLGGTLEVEYSNAFPAASLSSFVVAKAGTLAGGFSNVANGQRVTTTDGSGSFLFLIMNSNQAVLTDYQRAIPASQLMNISTRAQVLTGNNIAIGGFIIYGSDPLVVVVRAIGPSLASAGVSGPLQDPVLELHDSKGALMASNDNWQDTQEGEIRASGLAPKDARESALITTLQPGTYTAVMRGKNDSTGIALVEIYDLSKDANSKLANISTRGFVDADHVLIGGTIAGGNGPGNAEIVVRALGRDLELSGIMPPNILIDPAFEIHDADGAVIAANDDAGSPSGNTNTYPRELNPSYQYDATTGVVLPAGKYTVVVYGKFGTSGNALVEIYDLNR
jgi:autotransporter-associated beta strand protein